MAMKIMIVDDEWADKICTYLKGRFGERADVTPAKSEDDAVDLFSRERYDMVALDFDLGLFSDGYSVGKKMRSIDPKIRLVGISSYWSRYPGAEEIGMRGKELGLEGNFPGKRSDLGNYIEKLLSKTD